MELQTGIEWIDRALDRILRAGRSPVRQVPISPGTSPPLDIIVPIFDAYEDLCRCLDSLSACTGSHHRIWLMDDASKDSRVAELGRTLTGNDGRFHYRRRSRTLGFVANVNQALHETDRHVVVLNSDTKVTPGWLDRLWRCAMTTERVGVVSPLSNNATLLSVTRDRNPRADSRSIAEAVALTATEGTVAIPTAVGFCMLIRRELIDEIGWFDAAFSPGYGEEVDFCLRAWEAGWRVLACTDAYVHHRGQASFGVTTDQPWRRNHERLLASRWPSYETVMRGWWRNNPLRSQIERLAARDRQRPLVVHLLHRWSTLGGTEIVTRRLVEGLADEYDHLILVPGVGAGQWSDAVTQRLGNGIELMIWNRDYLDHDWYIQGEAAGLHHPWLDQWLARILAGSGASILHIHHLLGWGTLMPPLIGRAMGLKVIQSLHCLHSLCPDYNQIGVDGMPCGKRMVDTDQSCLACLEPRTHSLSGKVSDRMPEYLGMRRTLVRQAMASAHRLTVPSRFLYQRMEAAFGRGIRDRCSLIPHDAPDVIDPPPITAGKQLVAAYMGGLKRLKGSDTLLQAARKLLPGTSIEIRLFGPDGSSTATDRDWPKHCRWMGPFRPEDSTRIVQTADVLIVPSIFEETFSLAASEAWASGRPVIASNSGALAERVEHGVNGWLFEVDDAEGLAKRLEWLDTPHGRAQLVQISRHLIQSGTPGQASAIDRYRDLYRELLDAPRPEPDPGLSTPADIDPAHMRALLEQPRKQLDSMLHDCWRTPGRGHCRRPTLVACIVHPGDEADTGLQRTLAALQQCEGIDSILTTGHGPALAGSLKGLGEQWVWILRAGEVPIRHAVPALRQRLAEARTGQRLFVFDHLHCTPADRRHGLVCKPPWDPWLAATATDFDCGWVIRANELCEKVQGSSAGLDQWPLPLMESGSAQGEVVQVPLPVLARPDGALAEAARTAALRRSLVGLDDFDSTRMLPPVVVTDDGSRSDLKATLEGLLPLADRMPSLKVAGERDLPPGAWPEHWRPATKTSWDGNELIALIIRAGVLVPDPEPLLLHLPCLGHPDVGAIGLATQTLGGRRLGAGRVVGHQHDRIAADPAWPGGPKDDRPALRTMAALNMDLALVRTDRIASTTSPMHPGKKHPVLLASNQVGGHWFNLPLPLDPMDDTGVDPTFSRRLSLTSSNWQPDPVAMQASVIDVPGRQVLAITPDEWAASQYRILQPLNALARRGDILPPVVVKGDRHALPGDPELARLDPDVVLVHNCFDQVLLKRLRSRRLILVIDDLLTALPEYNPFRPHQAPGIEKRLREFVAAADRVIVSTAQLAKALSLPDEGKIIIENALPESPWLTLAENRKPVGENARLRVGWAGAQQHEGDLRVLKAVIRATADEVDWVLFGMCPDYLKPWVAEAVAPVSFNEYPHALASMNIDLAVAPLVDNTFNRCKSAIKLLEFGVLGIPVLASDLPPYHDSPAHRLDNDPHRWIEAISGYRANREHLHLDGANLRQWVMANHLLESRLDDWHHALTF